MKQFIIEPDWIALRAQSIVKLIHDYHAEQTPKPLPTWFCDNLTEQIAGAIHDAYLRGKDEGSGLRLEGRRRDA